MAIDPKAPGMQTAALPLTGAELVEVNVGPLPAKTTTQDIADLAASSYATGTVTLNGATPVTVAEDAITANSVVIFTLKTVGGTVGAYPAIQTITPTTGFDVAGTALDTSVYNYVVIN